MGPRRKFHLLGLVAFPAGFFGLGLLAAWYWDWIVVLAVIWSLYINRLTSRIHCWHCNHKLYLGRYELGPIRFRACVAYVGPECERCGKLLDALPTRTPRDRGADPRQA